MPPVMNIKDSLNKIPVLIDPILVMTPGFKTMITLKFEALGGEGGFLGKPLGTEAKTPDGRGHFRHYERGSIYWTPGTGAHEVHGAIRELWAALGSEKSFLGYPKTDELPTPDGRGRFNHFEGGSIYWTPETGAHEVHGAIRGLWSRLGWEKSFLGYPTTDELTTPDGRGRFNHFEGGSIYWTPETGAHEVHGAIRELWSGLGWEQSFLGYPTTDESDTAGGRGRFNHFEGGSVYWSPETGAHEVHGAIRDLWFSLGAETSALGLPVTDELDTPDGRGRFSAFEGGVISWSADLGAAVSSLKINEDGTPGLKLLGEGGGGQPAPLVRRRITASAQIDLTDDEDFTSNEHGKANQLNEAVVSDELPQVVLSMQGVAGGEMRVELQLTGQARKSGDILVQGLAKLFEGTSEQTDDLDGQESFNVIVPLDGFLSHNLQVRNTDEGGDHAEISITFSNTAV